MTSIKLMPAVVLFACGACPLVGPDEPGTAGVQLTVINAAQAPVRIGIDRSRSLVPQQPDRQANGTLTDITGILAPDESATLVLANVAGGESFDVYVIGEASQSELLGPFPCRIDLSCAGEGATSLVWTGAAVFCTGRLDRAVVELRNESEGTLYLLAADEQPALPLLPLTPGERRFVELELGAGGIGGVRVRAVQIRPILGPTEVARSTCSLSRSCALRRVRFDGESITCVEP